MNNNKEKIPLRVIVQMLFFIIIVPLLLDSSWIFIPAVALIVVLFIRTYLEDNTLQKELTGDAVYAERVRYRLIPGVW